MTKTIEAKAEVVQPKVDQLLVDILSWPRSHNSLDEIAFRAWLQSKLPSDTKSLGEGTLYCELERPDGKPPTTLFSCHIDTVDPAVNPPGSRKKLVFDPALEIISLDRMNTVGTCLGADDGAGVWMLLQMIEEGIPGGYIFHTGEERGGIGANATLKDHAALLGRYEVALAFDRPRNNEVITHQGGLRCCSDKFADALIKALNLGYEKSTKGTFTDTKVYRRVIPECVNLGVGYQNQHGPDEFLDYSHLLALRDAIFTVQWESLPVDRNPAEPDPVPVYTPPQQGKWNARDSIYGSMDMFGGADKFRDADHYFGGKKKKAKVQPTATPVAPVSGRTVYDHLMGTTFDDLVMWCETDPEEMVKSLIELMQEVGHLRADVKLYKSLVTMQ